MKKKLWKKIAAAFLAGGLLFAGPASGALAAVSPEEVAAYQQEKRVLAVNLNKGVARSHYEFTDINTVVDIGYEHISCGNEAFRRAWPELNRALGVFSDELFTAADGSKDCSAPGDGGEYGRIMKQVEELRAAKNTVRQEFFYANHVDIQRCDNRVMSFLRTDTFYNGAGGSQDKVSGTSIDVRTGRVLSLKEVCDNIPGLLSFVQGALKEKYHKLEFLELEPYFLALEKKNADGLVWTTGNQGLTVYFNPGELAGEEFGVLSIAVPFKLGDGMFIEYYAAAPERYSIDFDHRIDYSVFDNDKMNVVEVGAVPADPGWYRPVICVDEAVFYDNMYECNSLKSYLIRTPECIEVCLDIKSGDYHTLAFYSVKDGKIMYTGAMDKTMPAYIGCAGPFDISEPVLNPDRLLLDTTIDPLSTCKGRREYYIGKNGLPQCRDGYYRIVNPFRLTLKRSLEAGLVNENSADGETVGTVVLEAGTVLRAERTDNRNFVDMRTPDGRLCRVNAVLDSWPHTVNGEPAENYFDGISYST